MADIIAGRSPENNLYCKEIEQRQWLMQALEQNKFSVCKRKGQGRPPKDAYTSFKNDVVITVDEAKNLRQQLSSGLNQRVSTFKRRRAS